MGGPDLGLTFTSPNTMGGRSES